MNPVKPDIGHPEVRYAEEQPEYQPVTVAVQALTDNSFNLITRWQPTYEERRRIAAGEDIFVAQMHFQPYMTPLRVGLADEFATAEWNTAREAERACDPFSAAEEFTSEVE